MKKRGKVEIILIDILSVLIIISALIYLKDKSIKPEDVIKDKYRDNSEYRVIEQEKNDNYLAYLGSDNEYMYLDIFEDDKYFGGTTISPKNNQKIALYQSAQYVNLIIVYGDNTELRNLSYTLKVTGNDIVPKIFKKNINNNDYVLDIYILDTKYNESFDLDLIK